MKTQTNRKWTVLVLLLTSLSWAGLAGEDVTPVAEKSGLMKFMEQDYLFGTWGGARPWLS